MKKVTTLEQLQECSRKGVTLSAPNWKGGVDKPAAYFLTIKVNTLIDVLESGLFIEEHSRDNEFGPVRLMSHDTSTDLAYGTKDAGYVVGQTYDCIGSRNMDGYDYVLLAAKDKSNVWAGKDQVHSI